MLYEEDAKKASDSKLFNTCSINNNAVEDEDCYSISTDTDTLKMRETYETDFDYEGYRVTKRQSEDKNLRLDSPESRNDAMTEKERKEAKKARKKNRKKNKLKSELENVINQVGLQQSGTPEKETDAALCKNQRITPDKENNFNSNNTPPINSGRAIQRFWQVLMINIISKELKNADLIKR